MAENERNKTFDEKLHDLQTATDHYNRSRESQRGEEGLAWKHESAARRWKAQADEELLAVIDALKELNGEDTLAALRSVAKRRQQPIKVDGIDLTEELPDDGPEKHGSDY